jgi:transcriptional regulator with XRE-family HTH domain
MENDQDIITKVKTLIDRQNVSRATFAKMIGASKSSLEAWIASEREPTESVYILLDLLIDRPELEMWLAERYERVWGEPVKRKTGRWKNRKS